MSPCTSFYCCVYSILVLHGPQAIPPQVAGLAITPPFGAKVSLCLNYPLHLLWRAGLGYPVLLKFMGPTQGTFSLHSAFVGGELLPAAPLQPCAGAPSGRGHLFSGWVNLAPCNFFQQQCPPCSTGMGHPLGMAPCAEAPHPVGFIRSVGFIRALPVYSLPTIAHYIISCLFCAP